MESAPIEFRRNGVSWSVDASNLNPAAAPMQLSNTGHPAADTFSLARASNSHVSVFGVSWDDASGRNHGQYAPFNWQNA